MTNLEKVMNAKGIKQTELAKKAGVVLATMNRWVKGDRTPSAVNAIKIAKILGVPVENLFDNDADPYSDVEVYIAEPTVEKPILQNIDNPTLIAWFRCNSCLTCKWRKEVLDNDPVHSIQWCAKMHNRENIVNMVEYLGYSKE